MRSLSCLPGLAYAFVLLLIVPSMVWAEGEKTLPQPLTLATALEFATNADQFQLQVAEERLLAAMAEAGQSDAVNDLSVNVAGRLRTVGVSDKGNPDEDNDSEVSLYVRKPIYDFGKSNGRETLAELKVQLRQLEKAYLIEQRELSITRKYFDVLNADNDFLRHNEDLAIGFIRWDRARENQELGLTSELDVLERQTTYEKIRQNRYHSENMQRMTRVLLAEELGFPDDPPSEVAVPDFSELPQINDDVDAMVQRAFEHSLLLQIRHKELEIARQRINNAESTVAPRLDAELQVSEYAREGATRDDWRATIFFDFPLYSGNRESSAVELAQAEHRRAIAELQRTRSEIRVEVLKQWQAIRQNSLRLAGEIINQDYRDMYLDRSRAEYELEFKTDLGDAMVAFSNSRRLGYEARFALEMAWRRLEKLVGSEFMQSMTVTGGNNG